MDSKTRFFNLEKIVKNDNIANARLASLKLPRDLSLGGTKPKKIYAPNINVVRNKDKAKEQIKKLDVHTHRKGHERRNNHKQKEINSTRYVQSSGVFSEGTAEIKRPSQGFGRTSTYSDRDNVAAIVMPKLNRNAWNVNKKEEATIASDLVACEEDDSSTDIEYEPVILPLDKNKEKFSSNFRILDEMDIKVKEEPNDENYTPHVINTSMESPKENKVTPGQNDFQWIPMSSFNTKRKFNEDENTMSLIRLPDSLPARSFGEDANKLEDYTIDQVIEGQIGKIIVRKSGKMEVVIADTKYHLESEEPSAFTEEVVMFPGKNSTAVEPNLVSLGPIEEKFVILTSWDNLFQGKKT